MGCEWQLPRLSNQALGNLTLQSPGACSCVLLWATRHAMLGMETCHQMSLALQSDSWSPRVLRLGDAVSLRLGSR